MAKAKTPTVTKNKKAVTPPTPPEDKAKVTPPTPPEDKAPAAPPTPPEETAPETKKLTKFKVVATLHISEEVVAENFKEAYESVGKNKLKDYMSFQNTNVLG